VKIRPVGKDKGKDKNYNSREGQVYEPAKSGSQKALSEYWHPQPKEKKPHEHN
jgi:hypothetical protein